MEDVVADEAATTTATGAGGRLLEARPVNH
jgi:hypothetical protein